MYKNSIKSVFDFIVSLTGIMILLPLMLIIMIISLFENKGNPFFYQSRPGKNEKIFKILKFRTMNDKKDKNNKLLPDEDRLTKWGEFLRKTSLDEIPQLLNVLKGDMSLVGPRPLRVRYLPYYTNTEKLRHKVKPGITGLAQVSGRNSLSWDEKLALDVKYVKEISFTRDFIILLKTVNKVFKTSDIVIDTGINNSLDLYRSNLKEPLT